MNVGLTCIGVDSQVVTPDGTLYDVLFIGTKSGKYRDIWYAKLQFLGWLMGGKWGFRGKMKNRRGENCIKNGVRGLKIFFAPLAAC